MAEKAEHFLAIQNALGEGPRWNVKEQALYWVDIYNNNFNRYYYETGRLETIEVGTPVGVFGFRQKGGLVMATARGFATWEEASPILKIIANPLPGSHIRFNDGAVDRQGRFWAGSMNVDPKVDKNEGSLYRLDPSGEVREMLPKVAMPNGLAWSPNNKTMYFTNSPRKIIYAFDFDPATGWIENQRPFINTSAEPGIPDGLTLDSEGCIWGARFGTGKVIRYDQRGQPEFEIQLPVERVTSCAFCGPNLDELFITTAWAGLTGEQGKAQPLAGDLFHYKPGIKGLPEPEFEG